MAARSSKSRGKFWNFIDSIEGDKVVWIIVLILIMLSVLAIFSSTPLLDDGNKDRIDIIRDHVGIAIVGLATVFGLYKFNRIRWFMVLSQFGFLLSAVLILILDLHLNLGFIKAQNINHAWRTLSVFGFQLHVFEVVKVAMVMYLAWALHTYKKDSFRIADRLAATKTFAFMGKPLWKRIVYLYMPVLTVCVGILPGSGSSAVFIGAVLLVILLIGGIPFREVLIGGAVGLGLLAGAMGLYKASDGKILSKFERFETMFSRLEAEYDTRILEKHKEKTIGFYAARDSILQPYGAKLAVHEGGPVGKGIGGSTQKYIVTNIYGDYMFSFIVEEYGIAGAILVILLYVSLLARGSMIAKLCTKEFTKMAVGGLTLLITGQAFMHMFVNVDIGPMTGQTLPLLSHGACAFLVFCIAFGIILSISRMTTKQIRKEEENATPIYENGRDDIQTSLDVLEELDTNI